MYGLAKLRQMSRDTFADFALTEMAYVKSAVVNGVTVYAIHAANGKHLWHFRDRETAFAALRQHDLQPVSVH